MSHGDLKYCESVGLRAEDSTVAPEAAWIVSQWATLRCYGMLRTRGWRRPINEEQVRPWTSTQQRTATSCEGHACYIQQADQADMVDGNHHMIVIMQLGRAGLLDS